MISPHLSAMKHLLQLRSLRTHTRPPAEHVFERICIETLLFYTVTLLLFDRNHPNILRTILEDVDYGLFIPDTETSADRQDGTASMQPVLATSYKFFLLVADIIRFARNVVKSGLNNRIDWIRLDCDLCRWEDFFCYERQSTIRNPSANLAVKALRALLVAADPLDQDSHKEPKLKLLRNSSINHLQTGFDTMPLSKFAIWHLTIVGSLASDEPKRAVVRRALLRLCETQPSGLVASSLRLLESSWVRYSESISLTPCLDGVRILLDIQTG